LRSGRAAKEQLVLAHEGFDTIGTHGWERLVRAELVALGKGIPEPAATGAGLLTPQELQPSCGAPHEG
jgi:hypothetical protein